MSALLNRQEDQVTARELWDAFAWVPGPDLSDPYSAHERRRLGRWGTPTYDALRAARRPRFGRRRLDSFVAAQIHGEVGCLTRWSSHAPPYAPDA
jgi:hypothetical protein